MKRLPIQVRLPLILAFAVAASCGGGSTEMTAEEHLRAAAEMSKNGDHESAAQCYSDALAQLGDNIQSPLFKSASLGQVNALAKSDPAAAVVGFLEISEEHPDLFDAKDYGSAANTLAGGGNYQNALDVLKGAERALPESEEVAKLIADMQEKAVANSSPEELEQLQSLGYLSGD